MTDDYQRRIAAYLDRKTERLRDVAREALDDDEEFEILDVRNRGWLGNMARDLTKGSVAKQLTVGGVAGWCSGYLAGKVGKAAALASGGTLLVLQVAHHQGYITVNWGKLEKDIKSTQRKLERKANSINRKMPAVVDEAQDFVMENMFLAGGFCAGFLIGLVS